MTVNLENMSLFSANGRREIVLLPHFPAELGSALQESSINLSLFEFISDFFAAGNI